ncbi:serpentine type 7TM GPCR chemoreceptor srsx domain-containing protein [Ditylenchus destructor]|uniref:Serpentine type 7TM GPCR chemoreceptor srsx domain-containing protein n=1 Tax=Ditylenchus destructor TaxID=166010 RepID=A0AAD4NEC0_9BILA|nr:serpentine type 7TM GPCR chemoreceptor srsx domain-containing protein [Ditylenchus destructor]
MANFSYDEAYPHPLFFETYKQRGHVFEFFAVLIPNYIPAPFCFLFNFNLIYITYKNRHMHNPINILLAILCLSNAIYKMNDVPSFVNIVTATNFVPLLNCFYYQFIPLYGLLSMYQYTCVIAVDRTLLLIFPLWRVFI